VKDEHNEDDDQTKEPVGLPERGFHCSPPIVAPRSRASREPAERRPFPENMPRNSSLSCIFAAKYKPGQIFTDERGPAREAGITNACALGA
jgi:hypothetical protein